ncbi:hypothetical protein ILYODFUR_000424 [Ilyodon furcidens]|uniref:Secreted protein n=1 Tax=Ilyodon furcidens TaxID=33524 RepID=A0ABV0V9W0_9TELE
MLLSLGMPLLSFSLSLSVMSAAEHVSRCSSTLKSIEPVGLCLDAVFMLVVLVSAPFRTSSICQLRSFSSPLCHPDGSLTGTGSCISCWFIFSGKKILGTEDVGWK